MIAPGLARSCDPYLDPSCFGLLRVTFVLRVAVRLELSTPEPDACGQEANVKGAGVGASDEVRPVLFHR